MRDYDPFFGLACGLGLALWTSACAWIGLARVVDLVPPNEPEEPAWADRLEPFDTSEPFADLGEELDAVVVMDEPAILISSYRASCRGCLPYRHEPEPVYDTPPGWQGY